MLLVSLQAFLLQLLCEIRPVNHYSIYITFRGLQISAHVQDFGEYQLVNFSHEEILKDFTGTIRMQDGKYVPGYIRNKEAKDLPTLINAVVKQLR